MLSNGSMMVLGQDQFLRLYRPSSRAQASYKSRTLTDNLVSVEEENVCSAVNHRTTNMDNFQQITMRQSLMILIF